MGFMMWGCGFGAGTDISRLISLVSTSKASLALEVIIFFQPKNGVQEVKPGQATKCSQSPVTSVSSEDEIRVVLELAHLDSNTTRSNLKCKRQPENSAVSSLIEKKDDENTNSISIENMITAVQALPDMDEGLILDACDLLEDKIKSKTFMELDVKLRKKWLLRKLRTQQCV
ncbi:hypothetical protein GOBAR_AA01484 [Gossypium barbadense]|uniref:Uncharacterized protein n=1 Tax=Gossypium barbadense TaxID=3634 RepID=A0A2P5YTZ9_GOSBA|nr:hypothetical protein GOBAR_AA01484 [Gossypium barbadense]